MARVIQVNPGKDGHVRVATLHTPKGEFIWPVVKLVLLLPEEEESAWLHLAFSPPGRC